MRRDSADCLSERHLLLFGSIIHWFARYERLMLEIAASVAGSDYAAMLLLTRGLDFEGKRQSLLDLLRHREIPLDHYDRIYGFLGVPQASMQLRNDIAHSTWISVPYSGWIQPEWVLHPPPRVKPRRTDPGASADKFVETEEDKIGYSIGDLEEAAANLAANHANFADYLREIRLIPAAAEPSA